MEIVQQWFSTAIISVETFHTYEKHVWSLLVILYLFAVLKIVMPLIPGGKMLEQKKKIRYIGAFADFTDFLCFLML